MVSPVATGKRLIQLTSQGVSILEHQFYVPYDKDHGRIFTGTLWLARSAWQYWHTGTERIEELCCPMVCVMKSTSGGVCDYSAVNVDVFQEICPLALCS